MSGYSSYVVLYDANENTLPVQNATVIPTNTPALMIAGSDGANSRYILIDSSGRQIVVGPGANGSPVVGNPLLIAGSDGTNARNIRTAADGTIRIDPIGTTAQPVTDNGGSLTIDGIVSSVQSGTWTIQPGNTPNIIPWLITVNQGGNSATVKAASTAASAADPALVVAISPNNSIKEMEYATFNVVSNDTTLANNKSLISILNAAASSVILKIRKITLRNSQTAAVTGAIGVFELRRMTGHSGGTVLNSVSFDTLDILNANVTVRTGATVVSDTILLLRNEWSTDEWGPGTLDQEGLDHAFQTAIPIWSQTASCKPIVLRAGEGLHLKFATNSTAGTWDIEILFTQE